MFQGEEKIEGPGILDAVSYTQTKATLQAFNPQGAVLELLQKLDPRERQVMVSRYGLETGQALTLETIGKNMGLTRERIRQIEKEALRKLNQTAYPEKLSQGIELIFQILEARGNIARESYILKTVLATNNSAVSRNGILFILNLVPRFNSFRENDIYHAAWYVTGFDQEIFESLINQALQVLEEHKGTMSFSELFSGIRKDQAGSEIASLSAEAAESYISISKKIDLNPFGQWGLVAWPEIRPRDVGDKAYLVLLHHGKPEHYDKITEMINKQHIDARTAHKESVHNELIKDKRFVLVGRGIYALSDWGYHAGVVADIIIEVIQKAGKPLAREEIINKVLEQRLVKRNTIIVGLSNRKRFNKTGDNKYTIV